MDTSDEYEALQGLVDSRGWQLFEVHMLSALDDRFIADVTMTLESSDDERVAVSRLREMAAVREDRRRLSRWPHERMKAIQEASTRRTEGRAVRRRA